MCGRIRVPEDYSEIKIDLRLHEIVPHVYEPRWNVPPTSMLPVVRSKNGKRILEPMRWGLIPSWAKDAKVGFSTFNARADSLDTKPAVRRAWETGKRCLIVTDGFYEWRKSDKPPFAVALGNRGPMLMAGLMTAGSHPRVGSDGARSSPPMPTSLSRACTTACRQFSRPMITRGGWARSPPRGSISRRCCAPIPLSG